jgi:hypothetical protein
MSVRALIALAVVAAALSAVLFFKPGKKSSPEFAISGLKRGDIRHVRIERPDEKAVVLQMSDGKWQLSEPFRARADTAQVETLLSVIDAKSSVRYEAGNLERFDLEQPLTTLTLNEQRIRFGGINPLSGEQYVATDGYVYLISARHGTAAQRETWATRDVLADHEQPVAFKFPSFTVMKSEEQWSLEPPNAELKQQDFDIWVNRWRLANALNVAPAAGKEMTLFTLVLSEGGEIAMGYYENDSEFFLVRREEQLQYQFSPDVAKPLVSPPQPSAPR